MSWWSVEKGIGTIVSCKWAAHYSPGQGFTPKLFVTGNLGTTGIHPSNGFSSRKEDGQVGNVMESSWIQAENGTETWWCCNIMGPLEPHKNLPTNQINTSNTRENMAVNEEGQTNRHSISAETCRYSLPSHFRTLTAAMGLYWPWRYYTFWKSPSIHIFIS